MESYGAGVRRRMREGVIALAQIVPVFAVVAYVSNLQKALVASTVLWSIWVAVSARKESWRTPGFWWIVAFVGAINAAAIWALPRNEAFKAGLAVAYPLGMAEGFGVYWLLGWWAGREAAASS
jgi:hypothetical protein